MCDVWSENCFLGQRKSQQWWPFGSLTHSFGNGPTILKIMCPFPYSVTLICIYCICKAPLLGLFGPVFGNYMGQIPHFGKYLESPLVMLVSGPKSTALLGISVTALIRRSTPWAFIRNIFPFIPILEITTSHFYLKPK